MNNSYFTLKDGREIRFDKMEFMGIVNVTTNSFYEVSRTPSIEEAIDKAIQHIDEGASIIDIGGESTRPGSDPVDVEAEIAAVCPVIAGIKSRYPNILISVDTYRAKTAKAAIAVGADIVNDISGLSFDNEMVKVIASENVPIIIMHTKGKPKTMQESPQYDDVVNEVLSFFNKQIKLALYNGVSRDKIILDLGIGFGKGHQHNRQLLKSIGVFLELGYPHLLAVSRKTFIGECIGAVSPINRLNGTIGLSVYARMRGVHMARVHDVLQNLEAVRTVEETL